jgi:hypothetical protein
MYIEYLLFALLPLLSQPATAHDPRNQLCNLIALPISDQCKSLPECQAILASNCQDDTCACAYSAKVQTCVQCMNSSETVDKYNHYLGACAYVGKAAPSTTFAVSSPIASASVQPLPASSAKGQFTDITAAMGVETQAVGSSQLEQPSTIPSAMPSVSSPLVSSASVYRGIGGQTAIQAGAATGLRAPLNAAPGGAGTGPALPAPLNGGLASNGTISSSNHGISVLNDTTGSPQRPPAVDASIVALNSSRNFFSQAISQACVRHCVDWKSRADVSTGRDRD